MPPKLPGQQVRCLISVVRNEHSQRGSKPDQLLLRRRTRHSPAELRDLVGGDDGDPDRPEKRKLLRVLFAHPVKRFVEYSMEPRECPSTPSNDTDGPCGPPQEPRDKNSQSGGQESRTDDDGQNDSKGFHLLLPSSKPP